MIGGVFLLSRNPEALADWYRRHLGWELAFLPDEGYYTELYFREDDDPEQRQHLVFAIMPGDPGNGEGHIINYRVEDIEAILDSLQAVCEGTGLTLSYEGDWGHPDNQKMIVFTREAAAGG